MARSMGFPGLRASWENGVSRQRAGNDASQSSAESALLEAIIPELYCASGLAAEGKIAQAAGIPVVVGGGHRERTTALVDAMALRAKCLVSFGVAGGLAPGLRAGSLVLSGDVISEDQRWCVERSFRERIGGLAREIGAVEGPVLGAASVLATPVEKARAWRKTGALVVDLESAVVARAADAAGIPFIVLRAVADPATRKLPPAALIPLSARGTPELRRILAAILRRPQQIPGLIGVARETRRALAALAGSARALGAFGSSGIG